jgi:hypothetical protein
MNNRGCLRSSATHPTTNKALHAPLSRSISSTSPSPFIHSPFPILSNTTMVYLLPRLPGHTLIQHFPRYMHYIATVSTSPLPSSSLFFS